jgi:hypothetical protein
MSAALAFGYLFWTRHRRGLTLVADYWLVVMVFCLTMPSGFFKFSSDGEAWLGLGKYSVLGVYGVLCSIFVIALWHLILMFTFGREGRLDACESGFPARLWTLPLSTGALVGWPMLWGSATMILVWLTLAWAVSRLCNFALPLAWPALLLAALLAWLQAILWTPMPLPWLRVLLLIPVSYAVLLTPTIALANGASSAAVCGLLAALLGSAYVTTLPGVARARRGENRTWAGSASLRSQGAVTGTRRPFASPLHAQRWFEWRRYGLAFPVAVATGSLIALPLISFVAETLDDLDRVSSPIVPSWLLHQVGSFWLTMTGLLFGMPILASALGIEMGRFGKATYRMPSFLGTRPVSEAMLIRAKFETAAWSTLAGWGVLALGLLLWFALSDHALQAALQFEALWQRNAPRLVWVWIILLVGGAIVLTWLQMVQRMWIGLTGNPRLIQRAGCSLIAVVGLIVFGICLVYVSGYKPNLYRFLPWLAGVAVILKSFAAVWSLGTLRQRELISPDVLWRMLLIWHTFALGIFTALYALLPSDRFSLSGVVLGMVLLLPLTRLALAPLALYWNRHR